MPMMRGWQMTGPGVLSSFEAPLQPPKDGWVTVEVAGCGICHTDLGFLYDAVPTRHGAPLILGHEVSGVVVATGAGAAVWFGRRVIVPAVTPCGHCAFCDDGQPTSCRHSLMPGNDHDGGFASHVQVPARSLCAVDADRPSPADGLIGAEGLELWELAVLADAISTPLQAMRRCHLQSRDVAIIIGAGGVGSYGVQLARALGATCVALDVDAQKLVRARQLGAELALDARTPGRELKKQIAAHALDRGARPDRWRVFEMSGTAAGQQLAFSLITQGGSVSIVGYTAEPALARVSNLMAFDATAFGSWGCDPALYPHALALVASGKVRVRGQVRRERLADAPRVIDAVRNHAFTERVVLVP